jgi:hypothetical protein
MAETFIAGALNLYVIDIEFLVVCQGALMFDSALYHD